MNIAFENSNWGKGLPKILEDRQIYRAVMQVVSERGYFGATTKQMAEAADVSEVPFSENMGAR